MDSHVCVGYGRGNFLGQKGGKGGGIRNRELIGGVVVSNQLFRAAWETAYQPCFITLPPALPLHYPGVNRAMV